MENIKHELQNIIFSNEPVSQGSSIQKIQNFLRRHEEAGFNFKKQQLLKSKEASALIKFAKTEGFIYNKEILEEHFISEGAEQRVYRYDDFSIIKTNSSIFYEYWLDYFNSLLLHNYFFPSTQYDFLGFKLIDNELYAVVKQDFIISTESTNLSMVKEFLAFNGFENVRNNDYINKELGIIFEDLHDENVLYNNGALFFIDTVFYLQKNFINK